MLTPGARAQTQTTPRPASQADAPRYTFRIDPATFGAKGDGKHDDLPAIQQAIDAAIQKGSGAVVVLRSGHFLLSPVDPHARAHLFVRNAKELTILGHPDTFLICSDPDSSAFAIQSSTDVTINSLKIQRLPLLFTQGVIRSISIADKTVISTIDAGYGAPNSRFIAPLNFLMVFAEPATHTWYHDASWPPRIEKRERLKNGLWRLTLSRAPDPIYEGKPFVIWKNVYKGWGFTIQRSRNIHIANVAYYASGGQAGFVINHSEGDISFRHFSVDVPPGSGQRFASAGGAMVFNNRIRLDIEDSDFALTDDDDLNMGSNSSHVLAQRDARTLVIEGGPQRSDYQSGDHIEIWDWEAKKVRDRATVVQASGDGDSTQLVLDHDVHVERTGVGPLAAFLASNPTGDIHPARHANEYDSIDRVANLDDVGTITVRNSRFQSLRARNLLIKASNSIIENNVFHDTTMASILVGPEFYWDEGPSVHHLLIRNNTFQDVSGSSIFVAAHTTESEFGSGRSSSHPMPLSLVNTDIRIEGNLFTGFGHYSQGIAGKQGVPVYLRNVDGGRITDNVFKSPDPDCPSAPRILIGASNHILLGDNPGSDAAPSRP
jgi:hypothetical protein